ncbi:MAG: Serine/threonine-protein kinase tel1 [Phylliscum demangeonii]|nr:MAG: Serine/threonine-protein kinase tel1 [Phylliscum demangeonii]
MPLEQWVQGLCIALAYADEADPFVGALPPILFKAAAFAERVFPFLLHIVLLRDIEHRQEIRSEISRAFNEWFRDYDEADLAHVKLLLNSVLYLRTQPIPRESVKTDRERWLVLDYMEVAQAAIKCKMYKCGLLWLEIYFSEASRESRRSSGSKLTEPTELLLEISRNIDEPDSYYGVQRPAGLAPFMDRLDYERDGFKSLSFRGADYDNEIRLDTEGNSQGSQGLIRALSYLDLNGLSLSMLKVRPMSSSKNGEQDIMYRSARRLEQWDLPGTGSQISEETTLYRAFYCINHSSDLQAISRSLDLEFLQVMKQALKQDASSWSMQQGLRALAVLTEIDEVTCSRGPEELSETWARLASRDHWKRTGRVDDVDGILSARELVLGALVKRRSLRQLIQVDLPELRVLEATAVLASSRMSRSHGALQASLKAALHLSRLVAGCQESGMNIAAVARLEGANVLWDQGEMAASIGMLQTLKSERDLSKQAIRIGTAELLANLGHQISEARLQKPEEIISQYLRPAITELKGRFDGEEAGQVFHEFASFCDRQLQDGGNLEDYQRIQRLRQRKEAEVQGLDKLISSSSLESKSNLHAHRTKAKQWFDLDDREYQRLRESRQAFLTQSLENYLLCLQACDSFDADVLRFCALWLEHADSDVANAAVGKGLREVPSRKFVPLMNQLSSRLLDDDERFQSLLSPLIQRICTDHPYHGMYHIFSTSKSKGKDELAISRQGAAAKIAAHLKKDSKASARWLAIYHTNVCYVRLAVEKLDEKSKPGSKIALRKLQAGPRLEQDVPANRIPPPTLKVPIRPDCDYSSVPIVVKIHPDVSIAGGVSAPKIITVVASNGIKYKELVKGGNDDLRQDAIMEQVFDHVSGLLQHDRSTRQRNLSIRTYKVLPLTTNAGIIEFVPNTIPLHDYLIPAHQKHFPKDWKSNVCRKTIGDVQSKAVDVRRKAYRQVTDHFHPVFRYFFMERFDNPDDWFEKRLAYSRSTAAISILGHVLGLGDRHGHNILLDERTGEVAHIDLGVAFEQGRVLPVPEVVPFRLTRDIVDAMGITRTEGVFRRCCEFTLDALRRESYSIMTVLDVLRYDPLYSWTVSPLRLKKMQDQGQEPPQPQPSVGAGEAGTGTETSARSREGNEPSEADRALTVVAKKLSRTLSVTATVNELIQQATDERNLALLYCGEPTFTSRL